MSPNMIINRLGFDKDTLFEKINVENSWVNRRKSLQEICDEQEIDCPKIISDLNNER